MPFAFRTLSETEATMADSKVTTPSTSTQQDPKEQTKEPATLVHNVPLPQDMEKSKLDWLLQINEQFFEAELRTVVSHFLILPSLLTLRFGNLSHTLSLFN